jgi:hypothetical protein
MTSAADERRYPLYFIERPLGMYWRLSNCGLTLSGTRLSWTADGIEHDYGLDEIRSVRLQYATGGGRDSIGICQIRFTDGRTVTIYGGNDRGAADPDQAEIYSTFARDLHRRIPDEAAAHIAFNAGLSDTRYMVVSVATVALGLMLVGTPLVLLFIVPSKETMHVLGVLAAGAFFCWPLWKVWGKDRPRPYSPRDLPEDLVG